MKGTVLVLDGDASVVSSLDHLLTCSGFTVRAHTEAGDFFAAGLPPVPACLILDPILGDASQGGDVYQQILNRNWFLPTIFLTGVWDVNLVVRVIQSGADAFLVKPYEPTSLLHEVTKALSRAKNNWEREKRKELTRARWATLTPRERQVVRLVGSDLINKEIAERLNLALITVKVNRANAIKKLGAGNPVHMFNLIHEADLSSDAESVCR